MQHYIVKLTSGEFVYGVIEDPKTKGMVVMHNPLTWQEYNDDDGYLGSALVKFMNGTSENRLPIAASSIVSMAQMSPIFEEFYEAAVAVQQITTEAYEENLAHMTARMYDLVLDFHDKKQANDTGELVISSRRSSNNTIH